MLQRTISIVKNANAVPQLWFLARFSFEKVGRQRWSTAPLDLAGNKALAGRLCMLLAGCPSSNSNGLEVTYKHLISTLRKRTYRDYPRHLHWQARSSEHPSGTPSPLDISLEFAKSMISPAACAKTIDCDDGLVRRRTKPGPDRRSARRPHLDLVSIAKGLLALSCISPIRCQTSSFSVAMRDQTSTGRCPGGPLLAWPYCPPCAIDIGPLGDILGCKDI